MLSPEYLQTVSKDMEDYFYDLETEILKDIAERIHLNDNAMTSTANFQLYQLQLLGVTNLQISKHLSKALRISQKEAEKIISKSVYKSLESDNLIFEEAFEKGLIDNFSFDKLRFKDIILEGIVTTASDLTNICNSTVVTAQSKFTQALNNVYLQVSSGAFTMDQAVDMTVSKLAKEGLGVIEYKSGVRRQLDTAVRTAVRSSINKTALKAQEQNLNDFECNLVEVTSHMGARPSHAEWQGKIYWRLHKYKNYSNFEEATQYGKGEGLGGWNCRHSFYPFFEGISEKTFEQYRTKENNELYELQQQQRYNERKIREWKRRRDVKKAAGLNTTKESEKVRYWSKRNDALIKSDDRLKHNYGREKAYIKKSNSSKIFKQERIPKTHIFFEDRIPKGFVFSQVKEDNLIDTYIEIDKQFMKDKKEYLSINDAKTGKSLFNLFSAGKGNFVMPSNQAIQYLENAEKDSITVIHNHPRGGTFSKEDIVTHLSTESFKESIVITNDGEIFFFSVGKGDRIKIDSDRSFNVFSRYVNLVRKSIKNSNQNLSTKEIRHRAWIEICEKRGWDYGYRKI